MQRMAHHVWQPAEGAQEGAAPALGVTQTEFWDVAGLPVNNLPETMVMSMENLGEAALAGFTQGEKVTIASLPDSLNWGAYETARLALGPDLSHRRPAARYGV
ncbi:hypothetical protein [Pseudomonas antarctica]|uniref:hypothetical protein n=1 Tax=Pseudomonas antarctica TaxID=219572 RepID=UPI00387AE37A